MKGYGVQHPGPSIPSIGSLSLEAPAGFEMMVQNADYQWYQLEMHSCYLFNRNSQVLILFRFLPTATCPGKSGLHFHRLIHPHNSQENDISWHLRKVHLPREQVRHTICALLKLC